MYIFIGYSAKTAKEHHRLRTSEADIHVGDQMKQKLGGPVLEWLVFGDGFVDGNN